MADRYWVGGTASWDATAGSKWATFSGGGGGAAVPTSSDDVFFDEASGSGDTDIGSGTVCKDINCTGYTGTISGPFQWIVSGSLILASGMTFSFSGELEMNSTGAETITTAGLTLEGSALTINGVGGTFTLQDSLTGDSSLVLFLVNGTFDANNFAVTVGRFDSSNSNTRTLTMGSGLWTIIGGLGTEWNIATTTNLTFNKDTANIILNNGSSNTKDFSGGGLTYNDIKFSGSGTGSFDIVGSNTFATFEVDTPPHTVRFTAGTTTTATTWTIGGSSYAALMTLQSVTASAHTLEKAGGGSVDLSFIKVTNSTVDASPVWTATNGLDGGGNTNWIGLLGAFFMYLRDAAETVEISPSVDSAWEASFTEFARCVAFHATAPGVDTLGDVGFTDGNADDQDVCCRQYVSGGLAEGIVISGSQAIKLQLRLLESEGQNNIFLTVGIRIIAANGTTVQKTMLEVTRDANEMAETLVNRQFTATSVSGDYTMVEDDHLVVEIGVAGNPVGGTPDHDCTLRLGDDNASDLPEDDTSTSDFNPWLLLVDALPLKVAVPATSQAYAFWF